MSTQARFPTLARAARAAQLMIVPQEDYFAAFSECSLCTWVAVARNKMQLKYISSSCHLHSHLPRIAS